MTKKVLLGCMAAFVAMGMMLGFTSCNKDDDGDDSIVGVWTFKSVSLDVQNPEYPEAVGRILEEILPLITVVMSGATLEAKEDGTVIITTTALGESTTTAKYEKSGDKYIITADPEEEDILLSYTDIVYATVKNGVLTLTCDALDDEIRAAGFTKYDIKLTFKK